MSRWLGLGSPKRQRASRSESVGATDMPPGVTKPDGRMTHRRKSSEETDLASRRSSHQSQDGGGINAIDTQQDAGATGVILSPGPTADGTTATEQLCGWEEINHPENESCDRAQARPLSPGVDFTGSSARFCASNLCGARGKVVIGEAEGKWMDAGTTHSFLVRGPTYLEDKAKLPAGDAMCRLVDFDCFSENSPGTSRVDHVASRGRCREKVEALTCGDNPSFLFIMNIQVRGTPAISMVAYWEVDGDSFDSPDEVADPQERSFARVMASYADIPISEFGGSGRGDCPLMDSAPPPDYSDERNRRFKLIPRVAGGPWMVRKAVGSTPVLLGTKINHRYYRGERYIETDLDTGSSAAAASLCGRCRGLSRNLDVDLGIVLQANLAEELPEVLLGAVRLNGFGVEDPNLQTKLFHE